MASSAMVSDAEEEETVVELSSGFTCNLSLAIALSMPGLQQLKRAYFGDNL